MAAREAAALGTSAVHEAFLLKILVVAYKV
jgi:hypothetical protein